MYLSGWFWEDAPWAKLVDRWERKGELRVYLLLLSTGTFLMLYSLTVWPFITLGGKVLCKLGFHKEVVAGRVRDYVWLEWSCLRCRKRFTGAVYKGPK